MTYFNTTSASGAALQPYQDKAKSQEERILKFFAASERFLHTPSEIRRDVFDDAVPLTSVRRAITNLTTEGKLFKTSKKREGPYKRPEYCWSRRSGYPAQEELFG